MKKTVFTKNIHKKCVFQQEVMLALDSTYNVSGWSSEVDIEGYFYHDIQKFQVAVGTYEEVLRLYYIYII